MENITLGQINSALVFMVGLVTIMITVYQSVKTAVKTGFKPIEAKIDKVDMNATKNFLVSKIAELEEGRALDEISHQRFLEQYDHYIELDGNSYIKRKVEKLKAENKL